MFQIEALMGAPAALNEAFLQFAQGQLRVFPCLPPGRRAAFHQLRTSGGLLVSARHDGVELREVTLHALRSGELRMANSFADGEFHARNLSGSPSCIRQDPHWINLKFQAGESVKMTRG
ncbi:hypothetical protein QPK87_08655 [Kamptonema cortianum]|nr:hypothetical protein [Kamptonema cortianum]MDL5050345.1 hypothetical protein [Oscillatoria amoena NRMC-F 0135]MDL5053384.1 hypothetical protein [Oscillatoria laete-virens NRMC-F 0139]